MGEFDIRLGDRILTVPNTFHREGARLVWDRAFGLTAEALEFVWGCR